MLFRNNRRRRSCVTLRRKLRELSRLREWLQEDFGSRLRQLHRAVDLGFPEFTRYVRTLESQLATTILSRFAAKSLRFGCCRRHRIDFERNLESDRFRNLAYLIAAFLEFELALQCVVSTL